MMPRNDKKASKFLSLVLRHKPETIGITLDRNGYTSVDELLAALQSNGWHAFTRDDLDRIVAENNKQRFEFSEDETQIRASQGHSVDVDLGLQPRTPPEFLYHGTVSRFVPDIKQDGLLRRSRHHVHLSQDQETATNVGSRRGKPVILTVHAGEMHRDAYKFYLSANGVWLTDEVPPHYIDF